MVEYQYPIRLLMSRKRCSPRSGTANSQKGGRVWHATRRNVWRPHGRRVNWVQSI